MIFLILEKARLIENQGAKGGIVVDSNTGTTATGNPLFAMSGDGTDDVRYLIFYITLCKLIELYDYKNITVPTPAVSCNVTP